MQIARRADDTSVRLGNLDSRAINSRTKTGLLHRISPGKDIFLLLVEHSPTLLLVEKDHASAGEAFGLCRTRGRRAIGSAGIGLALQLGVGAPVEEQEKAEARALDSCALAMPAIGAGAGRIVQPVAGEGKALAQSRQVAVAGIVVAIESEIGHGA